MDGSQLPQIIEARLELSRRYQRLLPGVRGRSQSNLGRSGGVGALQPSATGYEEVYSGRCDFDILRAGGRRGRAPDAAAA